jgi:hypothetical protein
VLVLQSKAAAGANTPNSSDSTSTVAAPSEVAHRVMAYLRTNDAATKVAADLPVPTSSASEGATTVSTVSTTELTSDDSTLAQMFESEAIASLKNKTLEGHESSNTSMSTSSGSSGMPTMGVSSCPLPSRDIPFLGSANAPTVLSMIVAFSSVATVYASVNSGVHRITWLALLCLTCTGSVAFMLATDFLCRLPSTRFFGAVLRQRVTHIADNWQRHTVRSYLEIACWLGMMWGLRW